MFAYAHRYRSPRVLLLYPQYQERLRGHFGLVNEPEKAIAVATVNLHIDLSTNHGRQVLVDELQAIFQFAMREK